MGVGGLTANAPLLTFPVRGVPGGWRDCWDDDDVAEVRAQAEATVHQQAVEVEFLGVAWRHEALEERRQRERQQERRS